MGFERWWQLRVVSCGNGTGWALAETTKRPDSPPQATESKEDDDVTGAPSGIASSASIGLEANRKKEVQFDLKGNTTSFIRN